MSGSDTHVWERAREIELWLLDLDGTMYVEDTLIDGALAFIENLRRAARQYVFLTNNSSRNAVEYVAKIGSLGIPVGLDNVFTSGQATGIYLAGRMPGARLYVLGTQALKTELASFGLTIIERPTSSVDCVVAGFDTELTYQKIRDTCELLDRGVAYVATHPDFVCPIRDRRSIPDCGAICQMIERATRRLPDTVIGKPARTMVDLLSDRTGVPHERIAMVGDRLYTDIALGQNAGILSVCVLSGETTRENLADSPHTPDLVLHSINDLNGIFA